MSCFRLLMLTTVTLAALMTAAFASVSAPIPNPIPPTATPFFAPPTTVIIPPTSTSTVPNAKADPTAAVMYSTDPSRFRRAEFTYKMGFGVKAADDVSAQALGPMLDQIASALSRMSGEGAMEVIDARTGKVNIRMKINMDAMEVETVIVDGVSWVRTGPDKPWQKSELISLTTGAMDPASALAMIKNASKVEWVEETELNGERVHHLRYMIDPSKGNFGKLLTAGTDTMPKEKLDAIFATMTVDAELWLRAGDLQIRQQRVRVTMPMPLPEEDRLKDVKLMMDIDMLMSYTKVNEPVLIEAPKE